MQDSEGPVISNRHILGYTEAKGQMTIKKQTKQQLPCATKS